MSECSKHSKLISSEYSIAGALFESLSTGVLKAKRIPCITQYSHCRVLFNNIGKIELVHYLCGAGSMNMFVDRSA